MAIAIASVVGRLAERPSGDLLFRNAGNPSLVRMIARSPGGTGSTPSAIKSPLAPCRNWYGSACL
jgi:hypothetical protein